MHHRTYRIALEAMGILLLIGGALLLVTCWLRLLQAQTAEVLEADKLSRLRLMAAVGTCMATCVLAAAVLCSRRAKALSNGVQPANTP